MGEQSIALGSKHVQADPTCVGCFACATTCPTQCIAMKPDLEGFLYPVVDELLCTGCGRCRAICPALHVPLPGPEPDAYACIAADANVRRLSSSGGVFTLLAEQVLQDGGVVFGASFGSRFDVVHSSAEQSEEVARLRGAKYVQSAVGGALDEVSALLRAGKLVLFAGTPCQVAGLRSYLGRPYSGLTCIDLVCHGVVSPRVWRRYVGYQEALAKAALTAVSFRGKQAGWRGYTMSLTFENDRAYSRTPDSDHYMRAFLSDICLRPSCYACQFKGLQRQGDITLADFWGIEHVAPDMDDDKGTSLVLISTERGRDEYARISQLMKAQRVPLRDALRCNPAATASALAHPSRGAFFAQLGEYPFDRLVDRYCREGLFQRVRRRLGRLVRQIRTTRRG